MQYAGVRSIIIALLHIQFELFKTDPTQGYSYNLQDLTADFLCHVMSGSMMLFSIQQIVAYSISTIITGQCAIKPDWNVQGLFVLHLSIIRVSWLSVVGCCHLYQIIMFDCFLF